MKNKIDVIILKRLDRDVITCEVREIEDDIHTYYEIIGCRSIDIVTRYFSGIEFDVICDDEGLLKANETGELPTSWWQRNGYTPNYEGLFGVLVLAHHDDEGNLTSVTPEELIAVQNCCIFFKDKEGGDIALLFHDIERR